METETQRKCPNNTVFLPKLKPYLPDYNIYTVEYDCII